MTTASIIVTSDSAKEKEKSPVGIPCLGYEEMAELWTLIHDLLGGTAAMRKATSEWLPQEPAESSTAYNARLGRSILYNGFKDTLGKLKNRPFTHPITVTDIPGEIAYLENDVDGNGKSLEIFIKDVLENLIKYGITYIYVDHSIVDAVVEGKEVTKEEERKLGVRVYLVNISPIDLIGWQTKKTSKTTELTQIRIKETVVESEGKYGDKKVNYINVYTKEGWETHQQDPDNKDKYVEIKQGAHSFGSIPLIAIYANRTGYMTADPPLVDLAWLNLCHWQSYSDQRHILRFSRFGLLFGKGFPDNIVNRGTLEIGPSKSILLGDIENDADLKYVEHTGKAIESGLKDIQDIETKMRVLGNQPLIKNLPDSATGERIDESRTISQLQAWIGALEKGVKEALQAACKWRGVTPLKTMAVGIYKDFEAAILGGADKELLLKLKQDGNITKIRLLKEQQRRGVLSQDMDPEEEAEAASLEETNDLKSLLPDDDEEIIEEEE